MKTVSFVLHMILAGMFLAVMGIASPVSAQHSGAGTTVFDFLNIKYDARTTVLGEGSVAIPNDLYGVNSNPASVGFVDKMQIMAGNRSESAGIWSYPLAFAMPRKDKGVFAISMAALTTGNIEVTDRGYDGAMVYTGRNARSDNLAGSLTWAKKINNFSSGGVTIKGIYNRLGNTGSESFSSDGFALDAGLQYRFMNSRIVYGLATRNIGFQRSGYTQGEHYSLPSSVAMGVSYVPYYINQLRLTMGFGKKSNDYLTFEPSGELDAIPGQLVLRLGSNISWRDLQSGIKKLQGESEDSYQKSNRSFLCAGVGLTTHMAERKVKFDAAVDFPDNADLLPAFVISILADVSE